MDDCLCEGAETVQLQLSAAAGTALGTLHMAMLFITAYKEPSEPEEYAIYLPRLTMP